MLDFLSNVTVLDTVDVKKARTGGPRKERNPSGLAVRLFRDGSVYPSQELVDKFNLEYPKAEVDGKEAIPLKEGETEQKFKTNFKIEGDRGNGFDVIDTDRFKQGLSVGRRILILSAVNRKEGRVDLFAGTTYEEDGTPKSSVLDQGATSYGKSDLIPMVEEVYGIKLGKEDEGGQEFVDLVLVPNPHTGEPWSLPNGKTITYIPKQISRGKDQGQWTAIRRENPAFYAFLPESMITGTGSEPANESDTQSVTTEEPKQAETPVMAEA